MAANSRLAVAIHVMTGLAYAGEKGMTSQLIAKSVNTNPVCIRRILSQLSKAGLIQTQTGKSGGCKIAKSAEKITLLEIYRAVEEESAFAIHENPENKNCPISSKMKTIVGEVFKSTDRAIEDTLKKMKLSDLVSQLG